MFEHSIDSTVHFAFCPSQELSCTQPLDIVPVDVAINGFLAAIAASAGRPGTQVYQVGTSQCNPLGETLQSCAAIVWQPWMTSLPILLLLQVLQGRRGARFCT